MQFLIDLVLILVYAGAVLLIFAWMWRFWMMYVGQKHINSLDWIMLEIKLPREIMKSPLAMETALAMLMQTGGLTSRYKRFFLGNLPAWTSLEIASLEGIIHFYIRTQKKYRELFEANLYAQYPGIEISEADDYTKLIRYHHLSPDVSMWGATYPLDLKKAIGVDAKGKEVEVKADYLPLKTYVDYGLDKDPKEEFKTDPITPLLEFLGSMGKGEYAWYQVIVQDESVFNDKKMPKMYVHPETHEHLSLSDLATLRKKFIRKTKKLKKGDLAYDQYGHPVQKTIRGDDGTISYEPLTYGDDRELGLRESELTVEEKGEIEAINLKLSKPLVRAIIRLIYVAKNEHFRSSQIQNILSIMKPFAGWNKFGLAPSDPYEFPWQNFRKRRVPWRTEEKFEAFVEREGFHPHIQNRDGLDKWEDSIFWSFPMKTRKKWRMFYEAIFHPFDHPEADEVVVLNLEELATLWHFPGSVAATPTLPRIDSAKGVAPVNLPQ